MLKRYRIEGILCFIVFAIFLVLKIKDISKVLCICILILYMAFTINDVIKKRMTKANLVISIFIFILMFIYTFIFSPAYVIGTSMEPTFNSGQILLLNKTEERFNRFDVIVFYSKNIKKSLIKRVIGLPGDTVEVVNGQLFINGKKIEENFNKIDSYVDFHKVTVPENYYFVMGDNRPVSLDSRNETVGFVNKDTIKGKIITFK